MVLSFGLCNDSVLFQYYISDILYKYFYIFCTAYFDDILIYNNFLYKHKVHIKIILEYLKIARLFLNMTKDKFYIIKILYLGFIINTHSIKIDLTKI